jgi:hypothetical protein
MWKDKHHICFKPKTKKAETGKFSTGFQLFLNYTFTTIFAKAANSWLL